MKTIVSENGLPMGVISTDPCSFGLMVIGTSLGRFFPHYYRIPNLTFLSSPVNP